MKASGEGVPPPRFHWGTRVALPVGLLLGLGALFAGSMLSVLAPVVEVSAQPVVERASIRAVSSTPGNDRVSDVVIQAAGWIEPDPFVIHAVALTGGVVEEVVFREGDRVVRGDVLVRMIARDAELGLASAEIEHRAARETWEAGIDAELAAESARARLSEARAGLAVVAAERDAADALLRDARNVYTRRERLAREASISIEEVESARAALDAQEARLRLWEARADEIRATITRLEAESQAAIRHLELRTEERRRMDAALVALDQARLRMERLQITAPIDGVVMRRHVAPGSQIVIDSDNPLMARIADLYDPASLQVRVDIPLADAAKIGVGHRARITVEVLPGTTFNGVVTRLTGVADIQKNTLEVKVSLDDPAPELRPEMLARVRFLKPESTAASEPVGGTSLFVPKDGVRDNALWLVARFDGEYGVASRRTVSLSGADVDSWLEASDGVNHGDMVILDPPANLKVNQRIRVVERNGE